VQKVKREKEAEGGKCAVALQLQWREGGPSPSPSFGRCSFDL